MPVWLDVVVPSNHTCYILQSRRAKKIYIGYTVDFPHRLRQHNGEIKGGAKKTKKWRPWTAVCVIKGFYECSSALRFEYRLQRMVKRSGDFLRHLQKLVVLGEGSARKDNKLPWPYLVLDWYVKNYKVNAQQLYNNYFFAFE